MYVHATMTVAFSDSILLDRHVSTDPLSLGSRGPNEYVVRLPKSETLISRGELRRSFIPDVGLKICRTLFSASPGRLEVQVMVTFSPLSSVIVGVGEIA